MHRESERADEVCQLLDMAKEVATRYRALTGKPLGITGEVAEFSAAQHLGLELADARSAGYDAIDVKGRKVQIKGRCILPSAKPGQRLGSIRLDHEWDAVLYVELDENYEAREMWEASRPIVVEELRRPGSRARNERGALSVSKFRQIAKLVWARS